MTLAARLRSADGEMRVAAIAEAADRALLGSEELGALAACLGDGAKRIQRPAADAFAALVRRGVAGARTVLEQGLAAPEERLRWGAAYAIGQLGGALGGALPVLLEALGSDDGDTRWAAADVLARHHGDDGALRGLVLLVRTGKATQRKMALYTLRDLGVAGGEVEAAALAAMDDEDAGVHLAAMAAAPRLVRNRADARQRLVGALRTASPPLRRAAAAALGRLGDDSRFVREALAAAAADPDPSLSRAARRALTALGARRT